MADNQSSAHFQTSNDAGFEAAFGAQASGSGDMAIQQEMLSDDADMVLPAARPNDAATSCAVLSTQPGRAEQGWAWRWGKAAKARQTGLATPSRATTRLHTTLVTWLLNRIIVGGTLTLIDPDGRAHVFGEQKDFREQKGRAATVWIRTRQAMRSRFSDSTLFCAMNSNTSASLPYCET